MSAQDLFQQASKDQLVLELVVLLSTQAYKLLEYMYFCIYTGNLEMKVSISHTGHLYLHSHLYVLNSIISPNTLFFTILSHSFLCYSNIGFCSLSKLAWFLQAFLGEILHLCTLNSCDITKNECNQRCHSAHRANSLTMTTPRQKRKLEEICASPAAYLHRHISPWHHQYFDHMYGFVQTQT